MDPMFVLDDDLAHRSAYVDARSKDHAYKLIEGFESEIPLESATGRIPASSPRSHRRKIRSEEDYSGGEKVRV